MGAVLSPNEHYGFDFNYAYTDVYMASNICYLNGATATLPALPRLQAPLFLTRLTLREWRMLYQGRGHWRYSLVHGVVWQKLHERPTQFVSAAVTMSPTKRSTQASDIASAT